MYTITLTTSPFALTTGERQLPGFIDTGVNPIKFLFKSLGIDGIHVSQ